MVKYGYNIIKHQSWLVGMFFYKSTRKINKGATFLIGHPVLYIDGILLKVQKFRFF